MYKFVKFVDNEVRTNESANPDIARTGDQVYILIQAAVEKYAEENNVPLPDVRDVAASSVTNSYLHRTVIDRKQWFIVDPGKGRHFLDKILFMPVGFINTELDQYSSLVKFTTGGAFVGLLVLLWHIISTYL